MAHVVIRSEGNFNGWNRFFDGGRDEMLNCWKIFSNSFNRYCDVCGLFFDGAVLVDGRGGH